MTPDRQGDPRTHICRHCLDGKRQVRGVLFCRTCDGAALTVALFKRTDEAES